MKRIKLRLSAESVLTGQTLRVLIAEVYIVMKFEA